MSELLMPAASSQRNGVQRGIGFVVISALVLVGLNVNPVFPKYDDGWFFLVSYSWLNGFGFVNNWVSPIPSPIFNWHGFLQPLLVALLSPCGTLACVKVGLMILQGVYIAVWAIAVETVIAERVPKYILYVIGFVVMLQFSARPELLASLEMNLALLGFILLTRRKRPWARAAVIGALTGLVAVTDPAASVLGGIAGAVAICCSRMDNATAGALLKELVILAAAAAVSFAVCLVGIYPHHAVDWFIGMREHGAIIASRKDDVGFLKYFAFSRYSPMLLLMFVPLAATIVHAARSSRRDGGALSAILTPCLLGVFVLLLYWTSMRIPSAYYNFNVIVPTLSLVAVALISPVLQRTDLERAVVSLSLALFALTGFLALTVLVLEKGYFASSYARQKVEIAHIVDDALRANKRVVLDPPLIEAIDDIAVMRRVKLLFFGRPGKTGDLPDDADVLVRAQTEFGILPELPANSVLVIDAFDKNPINRYIKPESLGYAVYEKRQH